jgi:hypothetical protein
MGSTWKDGSRMAPGWPVCARQLRVEGSRASSPACPAFCQTSGCSRGTTENQREEYIMSYLYSTARFLLDIIRQWGLQESSVCFIDDQAVLRSYDFAPRQTPAPSPVSNLSLFLSLPVCRRSSLLKGMGSGWARSQIIRLRHSLALYESFTDFWGLRASIPAMFIRSHPSADYSQRHFSQFW